MKGKFQIKIRKSWGILDPNTRILQNKKGFDKNKRNSWKKDLTNGKM